MNAKQGGGQSRPQTQTNPSVDRFQCDTGSNPHWPHKLTQSKKVVSLGPRPKPTPAWFTSSVILEVIRTGHMNAKQGGGQSRPQTQTNPSVDRFQCDTGSNPHWPHKLTQSKKVVSLGPRPKPTPAWITSSVILEVICTGVCWV